MKTLALLLAAAALLAGCESKPHHYSVPDPKTLLDRQKTATQQVKTAKTQFAAASIEIRAGAKSHALAQKSAAQAVASNAAAARWITLVIPAVDSLILRVPPELKADAEALKLKVETLSREIAATTGTLAATAAQMSVTTAHLEKAQIQQSSGTGALEQGNAAINEINATLAPAYFQAVKKLAADASNESILRAKAENRVSELESKNRIRQALEFLAALAIVTVGILWFAGKLTFTGFRTATAVADAIR